MPSPAPAVRGLPQVCFAFCPFWVLGMMGNRTVQRLGPTNRAALPGQQPIRTASVGGPQPWPGLSTFSPDLCPQLSRPARAAPSELCTKTLALPLTPAFSHTPSHGAGDQMRTSPRPHPSARCTFWPSACLPPAACTPLRAAPALCGPQGPSCQISVLIPSHLSLVPRIWPGLVSGFFTAVS